MKQYTRSLGLFLCFFILIAYSFSVPVQASIPTIINTDNSTEGYFSVYYSSPSASKLKVKVMFNDEITYYDYISGETSTYAFEQGNGVYTISLFKNIRGIQYIEIATKTVDVKLDNNMSPYLVNTSEVSFSNDGIVYDTARAVCDGLLDNTSKVIAIHDFVKSTISYDWELATDVLDGDVKMYVPNAATVLINKTGICYDYAVLFAAMCRSQGIPCSVEKGYYSGEYHAWDRVYIDGEWRDVDTTISSDKFIKK